MLHSREPAGGSELQIAVLLFLSVTPLWLLAGGLGNTCWSYGGPRIGSGYCKLRDQIVTINKNNLPWPMKAPLAASYSRIHSSL